MFILSYLQDLLNSVVGTDVHKHECTLTEYIQKIVLFDGPFYSNHKTIRQERLLRLFYEEKKYTRTGSMPEL